MMELLCICCGAEIDGQWPNTLPVARSMCSSCTVEVDVASSLIQIEELAALGQPIS